VYVSYRTSWDLHAYMLQLYLDFVKLYQSYATLGGSVELLVAMAMVFFDWHQNYTDAFPNTGSKVHVAYLNDNHKTFHKVEL